MGVYSSKQAMGEPLQSPPVKRIEDPRSPTEEISRTPIEVADHRGGGLREANGGFSPMLRKASEPARKLRSNFESKLEEARQKENERHTSA